MPDIVVFGITGDLARRRIIPALARAWGNNHLPKGTRFIGFGRKHFDAPGFSIFIQEHAPAGIDAKKFAQSWKYAESELDDGDGYKKLAALLQSQLSLPQKSPKKTAGKKPRTLIYMSLPPVHQAIVIRKLIAAKILKKNNGVVVAIEKPFGKDAPSAKKLNDLLLSAVSEKQIYRVDHYAAKEELIDMEAAGKGGLLSHMNAVGMNSLEIKFHEQGTMAGRGSFYDHVGALNDVGQNHIMHMLGTVLAAPYASHKNYSEIRSTAVSFLKPQKALFGQYESFRKEPGVLPNSKTETYFKTENVMAFPKTEKSNNAELSKLSKRWQGLKVFISVGKGLSEDLVEICFHSKGESFAASSAPGNDSSASASASNSPGGSSICLVTARHGAKDAYQTIFETVMRGDMSHSVGIGQITAGWNYVKKVKAMKPKLLIYKDGFDASVLK